MYFVTLVTRQHECLFGEVINDEVFLNNAGLLAQTEWNQLVNRFTSIEIDCFILMPNHLHGILTFTVGARREEPSTTFTPIVALPTPLGRKNPVLGNVIGAYKSTVARLINGIRHTPGAPIWQRNYFEHVIRDESDLTRIRQYIQNNPCNWTLDHENLDRKE